MRSPILDTKDPSHNPNPPASNWQKLGEFDFPTDSKTDETCRPRLMELLDPLDLPAEFLDEVLKSAHDSAGRIRRSAISAGADPIRIVLFASLVRPPEGQTWGFFRIERIDNAEAGSIARAHTVEFYLYMEWE